MNVDPRQRQTYRILLVDDNEAIHQDFRKILHSEPGRDSPGRDSSIAEAERILFAEPAAPPYPGIACEIDSCLQGRDAVEAARRALAEQRPYALAFVDVRMPPGWDGIETVRRLWETSPDLQVVLCTAYSDYSWSEIIHELGNTDNLVILKKPFDNIEVLQLANALAIKWELTLRARARVDDLRTLVELRTSELEEASRERSKLEKVLRQAQKMEAVGRLAAGVAHDFNNILTVIQAHASLHNGPGDGTVADPGRGEAEESFDRILDAARKGADLTRQLLAFSRKQVIQFEEVGLPDLVGRLAEVLPTILSERIELKLDLTRERAIAWASPGALEQVLMNLALNARDAMPEGGELSIRVGAETVRPGGNTENPEAHGGDCVTLEVADTGCGMDPGTADRIFEPFFTTKEAGKGTGMGLSIVYGIIRQHGGWIDVTTAPDEGTAFRIYLPAAARKPAGGASSTGRAWNETPPATILLVEDEADLREAAAAVLRKMGHRVLEAPDGPAALEIWRDQGESIDLLFTDVVMPGGLSGSQLAQRLCGERESLRVLFMTGYNPESLPNLDTVKGKVAATLNKPFTSADLAEALAGVLPRE